MSGDGNQERRVRWLPFGLATVVAMVALYVASFAPAWRLAGSSRSAPWQPLYEPVLLLMERTPLRGPLVAWSGLWGARDDVEKCLRRREMQNLVDPIERLNRLE